MEDDDSSRGRGAPSEKELDSSVSHSFAARFPAQKSRSGSLLLWVIGINRNTVKKASLCLLACFSLTMMDETCRLRCGHAGTSTR